MQMLKFKEFIIDFVKYGIPIIALFLSLISLKSSRKSNKLQNRLYQIEEKLKNYELEEKEKELENATKACVEARIYNISKSNYRLKIWNSGKTYAYNVDFNVPDEYKGMIIKEKVPFEFLEPGKSFEEHITVCMGSPSKFKVITTWKDKEKINSYSKEQIVTI